VKTGSFSRRELAGTVVLCRHKKPEVWAQFVAANPTWCKWRNDIAGEKKAALLALAKGCARPHRKTRLGTALNNYTNRGRPSYDSELDMKIRVRQPQWFCHAAQFSAKKRELLALAKGCARPHHKARGLGIAIVMYTSRGQPSYDAHFDRRIRARQPGWFVTPRDIVDRKKEELLSMPIGSPRPRRSADRLAAFLVGYARGIYKRPGRRPYDPDFSSKLKERFPHWFESKTERIAREKAEILAMPNGSPRPERGSARYNQLRMYDYARSRHYDPAFSVEVRRKCPHWFGKRRKHVEQEQIREGAEVKKELVAV